MLHGSGNLSSMTTTDCLRHSSGKPMTFFSLEAGRHTSPVKEGYSADSVNHMSEQDLFFITSFGSPFFFFLC